MKRPCWSGLKNAPAYSEEDAKARIRSQMTNEERIKQADVVINNDSTLDELKCEGKGRVGKAAEKAVMSMNIAQ